MARRTDGEEKQVADRHLAACRHFDQPILVPTILLRGVSVPHCIRRPRPTPYTPVPPPPQNPSNRRRRPARLALKSSHFLWVWFLQEVGSVLEASVMLPLRFVTAAVALVGLHVGANAGTEASAYSLVDVYAGETFFAGFNFYDRSLGDTRLCALPPCPFLPPSTNTCRVRPATVPALRLARIGSAPACPLPVALLPTTRGPAAHYPWPCPACRPTRPQLRPHPWVRGLLRRNDSGDARAGERDGGGAGLHGRRPYHVLHGGGRGTAVSPARVQGDV